MQKVSHCLISARILDARNQRLETRSQERRRPPVSDASDVTGMSLHVTRMSRNVTRVTLYGLFIS